MDPIALRVVGRFARESKRVEFGVFDVTITPKYESFLPVLEDGLRKAQTDYAHAGFPIKSKVSIVVKGQGWKQRSFFTPNYIGIIPHVLRRHDAFHTFIHEVAHWYHFNQVAGGFQNPAIRSKFRDVVGAEDTGGSAYERLQDEIKVKEKEQAKLRKSITPGTVVEVEDWDNPFHRTTRYVRKYKLIKPKTRDGHIWLAELLNPSPWDQGIARHTSNPNGWVREVSMNDLIAGIPGLSEKLQAVHRELEALYEQSNALAMGKAQDTRYQELRSEWIPTNYAKENALEWFAELLTTAVLHPGSLSQPVKDWLQEVMR